MDPGPARGRGGPRRPHRPRENPVSLVTQQARAPRARPGARRARHHSPWQGPGPSRAQACMIMHGHAWASNPAGRVTGRGWVESSALRAPWWAHLVAWPWPWWRTSPGKISHNPWSDPLTVQDWSASTGVRPIDPARTPRPEPTRGQRPGSRAARPPPAPHPWGTALVGRTSRARPLVVPPSWHRSGPGRTSHAGGASSLLTDRWPSRAAGRLQRHGGAARTEETS